MKPTDHATFDRRDETGPFDVIGDLHGCADELEDLLAKLGYVVSWSETSRRHPTIVAPTGRRAIFVGDLVDRGPRTADTLAIVMGMCAAGTALCVPGNHDMKFRRWLDGHNVTLSHGLEKSIADMAGVDDERRARISRFIATLPLYLWLDGGKLVVVHAGITAGMIGHMSGKIEHFCIYGDTDSGRSSTGLPLRYNWAARYDGAALVVYGHTSVHEPAWVNGTVCIDTGCCFGGALTALRYPERKLVAVPARRTYLERNGPFGLPPTR